MVHQLRRFLNLLLNDFKYLNIIKSLVKALNEYFKRLKLHLMTKLVC